MKAKSMKIVLMTFLMSILLPASSAFAYSVWCNGNDDDYGFWFWQGRTSDPETALNMISYCEEQGGEWELFGATSLDPPE